MKIVNPKVIQFVSATACMVPPLPHSHCALRYANRVAWKALSPEMLCEVVKYQREIQ